MSERFRRAPCLSVFFPLSLGMIKYVFVMICLAPMFRMATSCVLLARSPFDYPRMVPLETPGQETFLYSAATTCPVFWRSSLVIYMEYLFITGRRGCRGWNRTPGVPAGRTCCLWQRGQGEYRKATGARRREIRLKGTNSSLSYKQVFHRTLILLVMCSSAPYDLYCFGVP